MGARAVYRQEIFCDSNGAATYREFAPHPALRPYVAALWSCDNLVPHTHHRVPDGCVDLVFAHREGVDGSVTPGFFGAGLSPESGVTYDVSAGGRMVALRLRWGAPAALLGLSPSELPQGYVSARELLGPCADRIAARLMEARSPEDRLRLLQGHFLRWAERRPQVDARVREAVSEIQCAGLAASVEEVAAKVGLSRSQLRRRLMEATGLSPKRLISLVGVRDAMLLGRQTGPGRWGEIAAESGFFDQAHLISHFRQVANLTPGQWLGRYGGLGVRG